MRNSDWFTSSFRRCLVDMHIADWDERFLAKLDPREYVRLMKTAGVQVVEIYANSHTGLCYWPSSHGQQHRGLKGRDLFGEIVAETLAAGMHPVAYFSVIYDNWAYDAHPEWRMVDLAGENSRDPGKLPNFTNRYGLCCPNSMEYREFVRAQTSEVVGAYDVAGIFVDMTFWPTICYCDSCKRRYADEVGGDMPTRVDWSDPRWLTFQEARSRWIFDFGAWVSREIKRVRPEVAVLHNYAASIASWLPALDERMSEVSDFIGGDRYGGFTDQSFACKVFHGLSKHLPFEYMSSRCQPDLLEHTTIKRKEALSLHTYLALAHHGAFTFIDAIEPEGSLAPEVYERMGEVFAESRQYEPYVGGDMVADVAVYFSFASKATRKRDGIPAQLYWGDVINDRIPHIETAVLASRALQEAHIPFTVVTKKSCGDLGRFRALILPGVESLDDIEASAIGDYVRGGGKLYVSGAAIVQFLEGILGIRVNGATRERRTYMAPTPRFLEHLPHMRPHLPLSLESPQPLVSIDEGLDTMAVTVLPYTDPTDGSIFASIHSDPPGVVTENPAIVRARVGDGEVIWSGVAIESVDNEPHIGTLIDLLRLMDPGPHSFESDAPPQVEIVLFDQPDNRRMVMCVVNVQDSRAILPVGDFTVHVRTGTRSVRSVSRVGTEEACPYSVSADGIDIQFERVSVFAMIVISYASADGPSGP